MKLLKQWLSTLWRSFQSRTTSSTTWSKSVSLKSSKKQGLKLATVQKLYDDVNDRVFAGQLTRPILRITRSAHYYGKCTVVDSRGDAKVAIYLSGPMHSGADISVLRDTLAHEMIHQWQFEHGFRYSDNHDETFTQWLQKVEEYLGTPLQNTWSE
jgi:hypothetical protein